MKASTTGLRWHKLDLHVHTPASKDYTGDKKITPEEYVQAVLSQDLDGIAVTDHNTAAWVDLLNAAANETDLAIFPGVEVSVTGGKSGIHIIAIFDVGTSAKTIEALLSKLDIKPDDYGKTETVSRHSPQNAINLICELGGLAVLPHADSAKGVLYDMRGQARSQVLNDPALAAVEVKKVAKHMRLLDGTDIHYRRKLAVYRASDNPNDALGTGHTVKNVGLRYSWFKMDGINLDALRQCFHDPEVRIITDELFPSVPQSDYPRIMQVKISQGFLGGCVFDFHEGLNSVIGGKGVGKSMLVESIRFGLNQPSPVESVKDDMKSKLEEQLGLGGKISILLRMATGQQITVERIYDGINNQIQVFDAEGKDMDVYLEQFFPVLAYSQTEALEIAKDSKAQLILIDTFIDLASVNRRIKSLRGLLKSNDVELSRSLEAKENLLENERDLSTCAQKLTSLDEVLHSDRHEEMKSLRLKKDYLLNLQSRLGRLSDRFLGVIEEVGEFECPEIPEGYYEDSDLLQIREDITALIYDLNKESSLLQEKTEQVRSKLVDHTFQWNSFVSQKAEEYHKWLTEQGGDRSSLMRQREKLAQEKNKLVELATGHLAEHAKAARS